MQINYGQPGYFDVQNKDKEIVAYSSKLEMLNKWVIDEYKDFYTRIQWITAGAISLSVPLLTNQRLENRQIFTFTLFNLTNFSFLSLSWISFVLSFISALYRNKVHPEYIHKTHLADWQKLHEEKLQIIVNTLSNQNTEEYREFVGKRNSVKNIYNDSVLWSKILWKANRFLGVLSQVFMTIGILFFVVFGITTLFK